MTKRTRLYIDSLPVLNDSIRCNSLLIIPNGGKHDSGYETMTYVVTDMKTKKEYKTCGCSDALEFFDTTDWHIDCVPEYHAVRLWRGKPFTFTPWYSSAEIKE